MRARTRRLHLRRFLQSLPLREIFHDCHLAHVTFFAATAKRLYQFAVPRSSSGNAQRPASAGKRRPECVDSREFARYLWSSSLALHWPSRRSVQLPLSPPAEVLPCDVALHPACWKWFWQGTHSVLTWHMPRTHAGYQNRVRRERTPTGATGPSPRLLAALLRRRRDRLRKAQSAARPLPRCVAGHSLLRLVAVRVFLCTECAFPLRLVFRP